MLARIIFYIAYAVASVAAFFDKSNDDDHNRAH